MAQVHFTALTTSKIRVLINDSADHIYSRLTEVEAWTATSAGSGSSSAQLHWLVSDQLGTPRMIFDQGGSLATVSRHDYLPFGEELFAGTGDRTTAQGYSASDGLRNHFTGKERDNETALDYFLARYYSSTQGRFASADPFLLSANGHNPQTWNRYTYVMNNPLAYVDPFGLWALRFETFYKKNDDGTDMLDKKGNQIVDHVSGEHFEA